MATVNYLPVVGEMRSISGARIKAGLPGAGQYSKFQKRVAAGNMRDARELQRLVAKINKEETKRPNSPGKTGNLRRATLAEGNRFADKDRMAVGIYSHLDTSQAKYWRSIERGSAEEMPGKFVGRKLFGWFTSSDGFSAPRARYAGRGKGQFIPYGKVSAAQIRSVTPKQDKFRGRPGPGIIRHEIQPYYAYTRAWAMATNFDTTGYCRKRVDEAMAAAMESTMAANQARTSRHNLSS